MSFGSNVPSESFWPTRYRYRCAAVSFTATSSMRSGSGRRPSVALKRSWSKKRPSRLASASKFSRNEGAPCTMCATNVAT